MTYCPELIANKHIRYRYYILREM